MATLFLEPGGDADFGTSFWTILSGVPAVATDFVHGNHQRSIKYRPANTDILKTGNILGNTSGRISFYMYINATNNSSQVRFLEVRRTAIVILFALQLAAGRVLQLTGASSQIGTNGPALQLGGWQRICLTYSITSSTVNRFEVFVDGVSAISVTNATLPSTPNAIFAEIGNIDNDTLLDFRSSDHYIDDSSSLTDTGNIWVTAKRPNANGTTNGFATQIGSGGSGYGTGHSPQINERPLSNINGWSMIGAGSAITEEYNIESRNIGDFNLTGMTIIDYLGWVDCQAVLAETAQIVVNGVTSNISLGTNTEALFTQIAGATIYPAGTGTDIGIIASTTVTTVSLYECGIIVAFLYSEPSTGVRKFNLNNLRPRLFAPGNAR